jgi:antibiotic biosynthesis monooxygenase (ABM) superfamily enzyme
MSAPVTIIVQTRARDGQAAAFGQWQAQVSEAVAKQPGFIEQSVIPPNPPTQPDWVILQRFTGKEAAVAWLQGQQRQDLVNAAAGFLAGADDVHLVHDTTRGALPAPVSVVISTRVKPGREAEFRQWERRIAAAQARAPGFQGYRFEPPVAGVHEDWVAILRFDSDASLQGWMDSPARAALLKEGEDFTETFHARVVRTGFESWFGAASPATAMAPAWKQNMVVLGLLYPVVFLFGWAVATPLLQGRLGWPFWFALFVGNIFSVLVLSKLVPLVCNGLGWWLTPKEANPRTDAVGAVLWLGVYAVSLLVFWRM